MTNAAAKVLIVSESGISSEVALTIENIVGTYPKLIAIVGKDSRLLEDLCDEYCERTERGLDVCTTSHPGKSVAEVEEFVKYYDRRALGQDFRTVKL